MVLLVQIDNLSNEEAQCDVRAILVLSCSTIPSATERSNVRCCRDQTSREGFLARGERCITSQRPPAHPEGFGSKRCFPVVSESVGIRTYTTTPKVTVPFMTGITLLKGKIGGIGGVKLDRVGTHTKRWQIRGA